MKKQLRKYVAIIMIVLVAFGCCACNDESANGGGDKTVASQGSVVDKNDSNKGNNGLGDNYLRKSVISAGMISYAIRNDGTIMTAGNYEKLDMGILGSVKKPDVSSWKNMTYIYTDGNVICGMDESGTLYGDGMVGNAGESVLGFYKDMKQIIAEDDTFLFLNNSGKAIGNGLDWTDTLALISDVEYITGGSSNFAALKKNGNVSVRGFETSVISEVNEWKIIVDIACGNGYVIGVRQDGTVVAAGDNTYGQCDVSGWTDIVQITANFRTTVGLKSDGTVVAIGDNTYGQCNVSEWRDIVAVSTNGEYTLGLKSDGTAVAVGDNKYGQCDVSGWSNIKLPAGVE